MTRFRLTVAVIALVLMGAAPVRAEFRGSVPDPDATTDSWKSNLDRDCEPDDLVDSFRALVSPEKFWGEQKDLFEGLVRAAKDNMAHTGFLLRDNKEGRGEFYKEVRKRADDLGYGREKVQAMIKENMARYDALAVTFKKNLELQRREYNWVRRCLRHVDTKLRGLGVAVKATGDDD